MVRDHDIVHTVSTANETVGHCEDSPTATPVSVFVLVQTSGKKRSVSQNFLSTTFEIMNTLQAFLKSHMRSILTTKNEKFNGRFEGSKKQKIIRISNVRSPTSWFFNKH